MAPQRNRKIVEAPPSAPTKESNVRIPGGLSPRSKRLIMPLSEVLAPYNLSEADIHSLVKRCGYDDAEIQAAVLKIIEEHNEWATTDTAIDRKAKAEQARERRLMLEKEQADEIERIRELRKKSEDDKQRKYREDAERRRHLEEAQKRRASEGVRSPARSGASTVSAWRSSAPEEVSMAVDMAETDLAVEFDHSPSQEDGVNDQVTHEERVVLACESQPAAVDEALGQSQPSGRDLASSRGNSSSQAVGTSPSDIGLDAPRPRTRSSGSQAAVMMPSQYAHIFASGAEPMVMFGSLHVSEAVAFAY